MAVQPVFAGQPDLVLLVVVDQLPGDVPERHYQQFGPDGFRYLMDHGTRYANANFQHANTVTCAGHATLVTGANARQHGVVANDWYDMEKRRPVNCVEDERYAEIGSASGSGAGRSPHYLVGSTIGDELIRARAGNSRVFAVSIKDRGAIISGGHDGKAFWYSKGNGQFVSSRYYYDRLPDWARHWNAKRPADRFANTRWNLLREPGSYAAGDRDDRDYERPGGVLGKTFPHPLSDTAGAPLYAILRTTPMGDELTMDFVEALVAAEQPGRRGATDLLVVSFSATDYIGHAFGPNSLEAEDNLLRLDQTLARLFRLIDREVGLDRTLIILSADHGVCAAPEHLAEQGTPAGRHDAAAFMARVNASLSQRFGTTDRLAPVFLKPAIYLDRALVAKRQLDLAAVERATADEIMRVPGFALALTRSELMSGRVPDSPVGRRVAAAFYPPRSGDVILVQQPFWYLDSTPDGNAAMHGSPHGYDTHVPLMFAGPGIEHRVVLREVAPRDLAPTLAGYLGIPPPSVSMGKALPEVLD